VNYRLTVCKRVRGRGARAKKAPRRCPHPLPIHRRIRTARQGGLGAPFRKVYEADPPECPLLAYSVEKLFPTGDEKILAVIGSDARFWLGGIHESVDVAKKNFLSGL
jgi:hypothetical protein